MSENSCKFYVIRKKRFCRMTKKPGADYCGEHMPSENCPPNQSKNQRVVCPLDNKHTCFLSKLEKHLKVCNAKQDNLPTYIVKNINSGNEHDSVCAIETSQRQLSKIPIKEIKLVLTKITNIYNKTIKETIQEKILASEILTNHLNDNPEFGATTRKHLVQTSSLLGHIDAAGLLAPATCYIEFGAGKGQLSYWVHQATAGLDGTSVMLIDRASHRHKMDNKLKIGDPESNDRIHRIRADINDLDLDKVEVLGSVGKIVGLTKHLCGVATDFALRCLTNFDQKSNKVSGLIMAFCCHHRCLWKDYVGKQFLLDHGITSEEFDVICGLVSWATSGVGMSKEKRKEIEDRDESDPVPEDVTRNLELGLTRDEKTIHGQVAKLLLDYGRMEYLKKLGFKCNLCYYVKSDISLENVCIVATK